MSEQKNTQDIKLEMKTVLELFENNFYIPSYQRGYRWTKNEVSSLLEDIYANKDKNYCLQPVVVKKREDNKFELIDGQQRITTLFILLQYIETKFKIPLELKTELEYETRPKSTDFIKEIANETKNTDDNNSQRPDDNIDFFHMHTAITTIAEWFNDKNNFQDQSKQLIAALSKTVQVIWYEIGENEDAISLFTRLNIGKIPLTNAELVKALFLANSNNETISESEENKKQEIAYQWDYIEKELHNDDFWNYFTSNDTSNPRIDYLIYLVNLAKNDNATLKNGNKYNTFFDYYNQLIKKQKTVQELWDEIQEGFYTLKEWYEEYELYHTIGYLIVTGEKDTLLTIYKFAKDKTKTQFKAELIKMIKSRIGIDEEQKKKSLDDFSYVLNPGETKNLLLLFNVETICQDKNHRFAFAAYKKHQWSLEHIHAQNSEELPKEGYEEWIKDYKPWIENFKKSIQQNDTQKKELEEITNLIEKIGDKKSEQIDEKGFITLQHKVLQLFSDNNDSSIHSIDNLALLITSDNSSLNNAIFPIKRERIIKFDSKNKSTKEGKFIPLCTKQVFQKYYTPSDKYQIYFWGQDDRNAYKKAIKETLKKYEIEE